MMRVEVYRNIRARNWSVRDAKTRKVIAHAGEVWLKDVTFKVSEAGRQRVLRERRKNVHAWVQGELVYTFEAVGAVRPHKKDVLVWYNPYETKTFIVAKTGKPIRSARSARFTICGLYVRP